VHPRLKPLYDYLIYNKRLVDISDYNPDVLDFYSKDALDMIHNGHDGWEELVPTFVDTIIKENRLFGFSPDIPKNPNYQPPKIQSEQRLNPN
jgi:hypothetical protein